MATLDRSTQRLPLIGFDFRFAASVSTASAPVPCNRSQLSSLIAAGDEARQLSTGGQTNAQTHRRTDGHGRKFAPDGNNNNSNGDNDRQ